LVQYFLKNVDLHLLERELVFKALTLFEELLHLRRFIIKSLQWLQELKAALHVLVNDHYSGLVVELTTVIWSTEHCNEVSVAEELIALHHDLVSSADEINLVLL